MNADRFVVVVHDVAPVFTAALGHIVRELDPMLGNRFSAAVVPCWHGGPSGAADSAYRELLSRFGERLLHGWTHQREFPYRLLSLLTDRADEFRGLEPARIRARIKIAQSAFAELTGRPARGFLPPAWQLPVRATELETVEYVMRFHTLESCSDPRQSQRLASWSWDLGRLSWLAPAGECFATFLKWKEPALIPCIAIHPVDVSRGWFQRSLRLVQLLLAGNYTPVVPSELLADLEDRS